MSNTTFDTMSQEAQNEIINELMNEMRIRMSSLEKVVRDLHKHQMYDCSLDVDDYYINHIIPVVTLAVNTVSHQVMHGVSKQYVGHVIRAVALLHDTYEDVKLPEIKEVVQANLTFIFPPKMVKIIQDSLDLLTKDKTINYEDNISRIIDSNNDSGTLAIIVKHADNNVNYNMSFMSGAEKRMKKYKHSMNRLSERMLRHTFRFYNSVYNIPDLIEHYVVLSGDFEPTFDVDKLTSVKQKIRSAMTLVSKNPDAAWFRGV